VNSLKYKGIDFPKSTLTPLDHNLERLKDEN